MSEVVIYTAQDGHVQLSVNLNELVNDLGTETIQLILSYAKTWHLLRND